MSQSKRTEPLLVVEDLQQEIVQGASRGWAESIEDSGFLLLLIEEHLHPESVTVEVKDDRHLRGTCGRCVALS